MDKKSILIISDSQPNISEEINNRFKIEVQVDLTTDFIQKIISEDEEKYDYIVVNSKIKHGNIFKNYIPLNYMGNSKNIVFMSEILLNPILLEQIRLTTEREGMIYIGILIKHIIANNIAENEFLLDKVLEKIRIENNISSKEIGVVKRKLYKIVKEHYAQNDIWMKIRYRKNRDRIIKSLLYRILNNVISEMKKNTNNNLVFKELVGICK